MSEQNIPEVEGPIPCPQYYDKGRYHDIPEETLDGIEKAVLENPEVDRFGLFKLTGDILSSREYESVLLYLLRKRHRKSTANQVVEAGCPACQQRALPWLIGYYESWHGQRQTWSEQAKEDFYRDAATLKLFAENHKFPGDATPDIVYEQGPCGQYPVQAEGTINGFPFYFRGRGSRWALAIARDAQGDPVEHSQSWVHSETYAGMHSYSPYGAGRAEPEECKEFIRRAATIWLGQQHGQESR